MASFMCQAGKSHQNQNLHGPSDRNTIADDSNKTQSDDSSLFERMNPAGWELPVGSPPQRSPVESLKNEKTSLILRCFLMSQTSPSQMTQTKHGQSNETSIVVSTTARPFTVAISRCVIIAPFSVTQADSLPTSAAA
jgi:hypothetical protein